MSGFSDSVLGGVGTLIRKFIRSKNYVAGSSGWTINQDGTAEFNSATIRGELQVGPTPPALGTVSIALTGTDIPAVLRNFNPDYTWYEADIHWYSSTAFYFTALVSNSTFAVSEQITGIYTGANVYLQTLQESTGNILNFGSSTYDTSPLQLGYRNSHMLLQSDADIQLNTDVSISYVAAAFADVSAAAVTAGTDTTVSAAFVNMAGTGSFTSVTIVKTYGVHTKLAVTMQWSGYVSVAPTGVQLAVFANGSDHLMYSQIINEANSHKSVTAMLSLTGFAAGTYTIQARWLRSAGAGTITRDINDWFALKVEEVST